MEKTLEALNELEATGITARYAIGGAVGLIFYVEPLLTYDLDVFCLLPTQPGALISLSPIYDHLTGQGHSLDREHIIISGIPVQFIPAYNELVVEAVMMASDR